MKWFNTRKQNNAINKSLGGDDEDASSYRPSEDNNNETTYNADEDASAYKAAADGEHQPATPYEAAEVEKDSKQAQGRRHGHLFFGCLCDMRIAAAVMACINIAVRVILMIIEVCRGIYEFTAMEYCILILSIIGLVGALNYMSECTGVAALGLTWFFIVHLTVNGNPWYEWLLDLLVIYPMAVITYEIHAGIMSKERYAQEEFLQPAVRSHVAAALV